MEDGTKAARAFGLGGFRLALHECEGVRLGEQRSNFIKLLKAPCPRNADITPRVVQSSLMGGSAN